ncbi:hypothetical protein GN244_ATG01545 [Phytophthora infestans]|uniref:Uncharacterized protein n=1 Tax=Phytophthora infestans TaxID=4787 RepID=A0A833WMX7_PHYIN|nr:hypothetical protein GN244_ATG01545 [Phytophthora infestans]KAF4132903.1 hypothetical protein GN958_ATG17893 [Phytophthora infestans]
MISHLESVIKIVYSTRNDEDVAQRLTITEFKKKSLRTRAALAKDLEDAFRHTGRCLTNWTEYVCNDKTFWWPCLLMRRRLAERFSTRLKDKGGYVTVAMFKKEPFNVVWINSTRIPFSDWTNEKLISECGKEVINECGEEVIGECDEEAISECGEETISKCDEETIKRRSGKDFCSRLREAYAQALYF